MTNGTVSEEQRRETRESWSRMDVIDSGVVLLLILLAHLYFSG